VLRETEKKKTDRDITIVGSRHCIAVITHIQKKLIEGNELKNTRCII
jgi:hypothetical protein